MTQEERIAQKLAFVAERIRRGSYSPEDVKRSLLGLPIDQSVVTALIQAAANRKPERPVYPVFTNTPRRPRPIVNKNKSKWVKLVFCKEAEYITNDEGKRVCLGHHYQGSWDFSKRLFIKSFSGKDIDFTRDEKEACYFKTDKECDACMAKLVMEHNAYTIAQWDSGGQMVHYPGDHWYDNGFLIPTFIERKGVGDFYKENIKFDRNKGWIAHEWKNKDR